MLETLLTSPEHPALSSSCSSVFQQYLSLDPFLITGTAWAGYMGYTGKNLVDLVLPLVVASADNLFQKVVDSGYSFEQLGKDVKMEALFLAGAYFLGLIASRFSRTSSHRKSNFACRKV